MLPRIPSTTALAREIVAELPNRPVLNDEVRDIAEIRDVDRDQRRSARFSHTGRDRVCRWPKDRSFESANAIARQVSGKISAQISGKFYDEEKSQTQWPGGGKSARRKTQLRKKAERNERESRRRQRGIDRTFATRANEVEEQTRSVVSRSGGRCRCRPVCRPRVSPGRASALRATAR